MTKFTFQGTGQTVGGGGKGLMTLAAVGVGVAVAYEAVKSAASTLGDLLVIVPVAAGSLAVGAVVTYVAVRMRRPRQPASPDRPALWRVRADALPPRAPRAIAPPPAVTVNIGADLLAGLADLMHAAQQRHAPVIVQSEQQELPR